VTDQKQTLLGRNLRPAQAAEILGISLATFWRLTQQKGFPTLIQLSPRVTVVREADLAEFMDGKAKAAREAKEGKFQ
jgi:predicted DNA-binding transcriptional regulator AlpA